MGVSDERAGRNEGLFREVNENIARLDKRLSEDGSDSLPLICECALTDCMAKIEISTAEYARVRRHPNWFIVVPGHEQHSVEQAVEQHGGYSIVEKHGVAAAAADASYRLVRRRETGHEPHL